MYQVIQDGAKIGLDERDLKEVVQNRLNNKKETESLFSGVFKVPTYNEKAFGSMIKRLERENPSAAIKVDEQVNTVKQIFNDLNRTFQNFDLGGSKDSFENILDRELTPGVKEIRIRPQTFNILPTSSSPTTPGGSFTINTPQVSANILSVNQQQQQQQPQTFGERFAILFPRG